MFSWGTTFQHKKAKIPGLQPKQDADRVHLLASQRREVYINISTVVQHASKAALLSLAALQAWSCLCLWLTWG